MRQDTYEAIMAVVNDAGNAVAMQTPAFAQIITIAWDNIRNQVLGQADSIIATGKNIDPTQLKIMLIDALTTQCRNIYNQAQQRQQIAPTGFNNMALGGPSFMSGLSGIAGPVNPYASVVANNQQVNPQPPMATTISKEILSISNNAKKNIPATQNGEIVQPLRAEKIDKPKYIEVVVNEYDSKTEEEKELMMIAVNDCQTKEVLELGTNDECSELKFSIDDSCAAKVYLCTIKSKGFTSAISASRYMLDNIVNEVSGRVYVNIEYTHLYSLKTSNSDSQKIFKAIKAIEDDAVGSAKTKLAKIKEILDDAKKATADEIDSLIINMINKFTTKGILGADGENANIKFNTITNILDVFGTKKNIEFASIKADEQAKSTLSTLILKVINKVATAKVYSYDNASDVPFIMDCIGSKRSNNTVLRSIENLLLTKKAKTATKTEDKLQSNPCYGELKKYTVIGIQETAIFTNCPLDLAEVEDCPNYIDICTVSFDASAPTTYFEFFLKNYSLSDGSNAEVLLQQNDNAIISYLCFVSEGLIWLTV